MTESGIEYRSKKEALIILADQELLILPNPVSSEMTVQLINKSSLIKEISIASLNGRILVNQVLQYQSTSVNLNTMNLEPGIYLIEVIDNSNQKYKIKFIKN